MVQDLTASFMLEVHAKPDSDRAAFLRRGMSALERIADSVPNKTLLDALSAPTGAGSLAQLLSQVDIVGSAVIDLDPLVPALARNLEHREHLLRLGGGAYSAEEAGRLLGITRQAVDKRRRANTLLALRSGSDWHYPACQFDQGEVIAGLAEVIAGFASAGPWIALDFLLAPDTMLDGQTPLEALRRGLRDAVLRLARATGEMDGFA
ncbi:hypothetical protein ABIB57_004394 [Devosia sp. UYZn731]|uniref:DNA-binding protein n=1 Tax=Devosia sp. UYZn731 TaxID=3156345 RepID=UPI003399F3C8